MPVQTQFRAPETGPLATFTLGGDGRPATTADFPPAALARPRGVHIDDILGCADGRFFGSGYRRVAQRLVDLAWNNHMSSDLDNDARPGSTPAPGRSAAGRANVSYPIDWSRKQAPGLVPHLSSLDALALSLRMVETFLVNGYRLRPGQLSRAWLRRFVMKSGATPYEDLDEVELHIAERESGQFDCTVGNIRVRCEIEHDGLEPRPCDPDRPELDIPSFAQRPAAYQNHVHELTDVIVDVPGKLASTSVRTVNAVAPPPRTEELGSAYQPTTGLIDSMIVLAQAGQALLYRSDDLDRAETNTLWMRRVDMWRDVPKQPLGLVVPCTTGVKRNSIVDYGGARWRASNMVGTVGATTVQYSVGHQLPANEGGAL